MPNTYYIQDDGTIDRMETHPQNPLPPTLQQRLEAAESEAAALREQLATVTLERNAALERIAMVKWQRYRAMGGTDSFNISEWLDETPLGQALDGLGDEVE